MRGYILKGSKVEKREYVGNFISEHEIPTYNIFKFLEPLKIADVREIKKNISLSPAGGKNRVFIIESDPTTEAQNALLKTLEESPEGTSFIFTLECELLPTIVSRCSTVKLGAVYSPSVDDEDMEIVRSLLNSRDTSRKLLEIEKFFSKEREDPFAYLLLCVREAILKEAPNRFALLKELVKYYPLVSSNNLNPRLTAEKILIIDTLGLGNYAL